MAIWDGKNGDQDEDDKSLRRKQGGRWWRRALRCGRGAVSWGREEPGSADGAETGSPGCGVGGGGPG